jgi:DNA-binding LacI/PurR family transcriptional regulator
MATIRDVARAAGVSASTVSNVLNGRADQMSRATRERILRIIEALGYRPNRLAQGLARNRTASIGLIVANLGFPGNPRIFAGVEAVANAAGYAVLVYNVHDEAMERQALQVLSERRVDGIVFLSGSNLHRHEHLAALRQQAMPFVVINREPVGPGVVMVRFDNHGGSAAATSHLLRLGHRRIAHLGGPYAGPGRRFSAVERLAGYEQALRQHGSDVRPDYVAASDYSFASGVEAAVALLAQRPRPTAIVAAGESIALAALRAAVEHGLRVPDDLSIVGFGDESLARYVTPPLTTVALPSEEAGRRATELLLRRLTRPGNGMARPGGAGGAEPTAVQRSSRGRTVLMPTTLVVRGSTTAPPPE